jgi:hypothetical protein
MQPGQYYDGLRIRESPAFMQPRPARRRTSKAERFFASAVHAAEQVQRMGIAVTPSAIHQNNYELPLTVLVELFEEPKFLNALEDRGVALPGAPGLDPHQLSALAIYLDMTVPMTHAQKLKAANVSEARWRGWQKQPEFARRLAALAEDLIAESTPVALQRLAQLVDAGNLKAVELQLELSGRHDRRKETIDVNALLLGIFAVLDEEVDAATLSRISDKVRSMMGQNTPAQVLQVTSQPVPHVVIEPLEG